MRNAGGSQVSEAVLKSLFLEQMPEQVHPILTGSNESNLDRLVVLADKIIEVQRPNALACVDHPTKEGDNLTTALVALTKKLETFDLKSRQRNRRSRSKSTSRSRTNPNTYCYYHKKFGADSRKCRAPYAWKGESKSEN